jgi:multidrug efflux system membrane fusion protein
VILVVLILLGGGATYYYIQSAPPAGAGGAGMGGGFAGGGGRGGGRRGGMPLVPVTTAAAKQGEMKVYLKEIGTVTAWNTITVHSRVDGLLLKYDVEDGQRVKAGDVLAELDPSTYEFALEQAQGQLIRDQALLDNAVKDVDRYTKAGDAAPTQSLDLAVATVAQYKGTVRTDQGVVDNDKLLLGWCKLVAPISGRAGIRLVDSGNMIHASDAGGLMVITQDQPIAVFFNIPEDALPQVRQALEAGPPPAVEAFDSAETQSLATGKVIALDNQIDATTGTVRLKAEFANDDGSLFPNQFVNVRLLVRTMADATLIPVAAVQINGASRFVYVVNKEGVVEQRPVVTGPQDGDTIAITSGLTPGEVVVTEGLDKLQTGTVVSPKAGGGGGRRGGRGDGSGRGSGAGRGDGSGRGQGTGRGGRGADQPEAPTTS